MGVHFSFHHLKFLISFISHSSFERSDLSGGYCGGVPPLPIPNREVKPACADGTAMQCGRVGGRHFLKKSPVITTIAGLLHVISAVGRHIHVLHRSTGNPWGDIGRGALLSWRGGNADVALRVAVAWSASAQPFACRRVDRGCPARLRSRCLSSGRCGSRSGRLSAIPDVLALSFRHDG